MLTRTSKPQEPNRSTDQAQANQATSYASDFEDKRPSTLVQKKLQHLANQSVRTQQLKKVQAMANGHNTLAGNVVQREISVKVHNVRDKYNDRIDTFIQQLSDAVEKARLYVMNVPTLGAFADQDGHTLHWVDTWNSYVKKGDAHLINAAFGYAVETIATIYLGDAPAGLTYTTQVPKGGTRPDVILIDEETGKDVAWLDITSNHPASVRHIINDKVLWDQQDHYGEVVYEALTASDLVNMKDAPGVFDDKIDKEQFWKKRQFGKYLHDQRRKHWMEVGEKYFSTPLLTKGEDIYRKPINKADIIARLKKHFKIDLDDKMAASILYAMGIGRAKFGLDASVSRNFGESLLLNHDPNLPVVPMPKFGVPRHVGMNQEDLAKFQERELSLRPEILPSSFVPTSNALTLFQPQVPQALGTSAWGGSQGFHAFTGFQHAQGFPPFSMFGQQAPAFNFNFPNFADNTFNGLVPTIPQQDKEADLSFIFSLGKRLRANILNKVIDVEELYRLEEFIKKQAKGRQNKIKTLKVLLGSKKGNLFLLDSGLKSKRIKKLKHRLPRASSSEGQIGFDQVSQVGFGQGTQLGFATVPSAITAPEEEQDMQEEFDPRQSYQVMGFVVEDDIGNRDISLTLSLNIDI